MADGRKIYRKVGILKKDHKSAGQLQRLYLHSIAGVLWLFVTLSNSRIDEHVIKSERAPEVLTRSIIPVSLIQRSLRILLC